MKNFGKFLLGVATGVAAVLVIYNKDKVGTVIKSTYEGAKNLVTKKN